MHNESHSILDQGNLITVEELAAFRRSSPQAIYQERLRGDKPGALGIRIGRRVLFRQEDIKAWLDEVQTEQTVDLDW